MLKVLILLICQQVIQVKFDQATSQVIYPSVTQIKEIYVTKSHITTIPKSMNLFDQISQIYYPLSLQFLFEFPSSTSSLRWLKTFEANNSDHIVGALYHKNAILTKLLPNNYNFTIDPISDVLKYTFGESQDSVYFVTYWGAFQIKYQYREQQPILIYNFSAPTAGEFLQQIVYSSNSLFLTFYNSQISRIIKIENLQAGAILTTNIAFSSTGAFVNFACNGLYCLHTSTGKAIIKYQGNLSDYRTFLKPNITSSCLVGSKYLIITHGDGSFDQINIDSGEPMHRILLPMTGMPYKVFQMDNNVLAITTEAEQKVYLYQLLDIIVCLGGCGACNYPYSIGPNLECFYQPYTENFPPLVPINNSTLTMITDLASYLASQNTTSNRTSSNGTNTTNGNNSTNTTNSTYSSNAANAINVTNSDNETNGTDANSTNITNPNSAVNSVITDTSPYHGDGSAQDDLSQTWVRQVSKFLGNSLSMAYFPTFFKAMFPLIFLLEDLQLYQYHRNVNYTEFMKLCMQEINLINALRIEPEYSQTLRLNFQIGSSDYYSELYSYEVYSKKQCSIQDKQVYFLDSIKQVLYPSTCLHLCTFIVMLIIRIIINRIPFDNETIGRDFVENYSKKTKIWILIPTIVDPNLFLIVYNCFNQFSLFSRFQSQNILSLLLCSWILFAIIIYAVTYHFMVFRYSKSSSENYLSFTKFVFRGFLIESIYIYQFKILKCFLHSNLIPTNQMKLIMLFMSNLAMVFLFIKQRKYFTNTFLALFYISYEVFFCCLNLTMWIYQTERVSFQYSNYQKWVFWEIILLILITLFKMLGTVYLDLKAIVQYIVKKNTQVAPSVNKKEKSKQEGKAKDRQGNKKDKENNNVAKSQANIDKKQTAPLKVEEIEQNYEKQSPTPNPKNLKIKFVSQKKQKATTQ